VALVPASISVAKEGAQRTKAGAYLLATVMLAGTLFAVGTSIYKLADV
jgi:hypothetical protein